MKAIQRIAVCALALSAIFSCRKQMEYPSNPYLYLGDGMVAGALTFDYKGTVYDGSTVLDMKQAWGTTGQCPRIDLHSNLPAWSIAPEDANDTSWIYIWTPTGSQSGKFYVSVDRNLRSEDRVAAINISDGNGKVWQTFKIFQTGSSPYLDLNMSGVSNFNVLADEGSFTVKLNTNSKWVIKEEAPAWMSFSQLESDSFHVNYEINRSESVRSATFTIACENPEYVSEYVNFSVSQSGSGQTFDKASKIGIASLRSMAPGSTITDNVYIEGVVISDNTRCNLDEHYFGYEKDKSNFTAVFSNIPLWIQDEAGDGICVEFLTDRENVYPLGTHLKLHVVGRTVDRNAAGVLRIGAMMADCVHDQSLQEEPAPVQVYDLSNIADYEDRLVTLKDVQLVTPYGTYFNVDNRKVDENYTTFPAMLDATSRECPHMLYDKYGNTVRMVTSATFLDRHCRLMPQGIGDITGIVTRRMSKGESELYLRIRHDDDNKIEQERSEACSKVLVRFGPFAKAADMKELKANEGSATIKTSVFSKVTVEAGSTSMYYAYSSIWNRTFDNVTKDVRTFTPSPENQFYTLNAQQWYNATGTSITDAPGEAWIITTNTLNAGDGDLYIVMNNASYGAGPKDFRLEWAEDENTPLGFWNKVEDYEAASWVANWQAGDYMFKLPPEVKGREKIVFRHRVTSNMSIYTPTRTISSSGTNRINYWALIEL